jgi:hypothetical protein
MKRGTACVGAGELLASLAERDELLERPAN